jgi:Cell division protein CrgA
VLGARRDLTREITVPKSRVRKKAVYTPPQRSSKAAVSPSWLAPTMIACLVVGLAWIATFYVSGQKLPIIALHQWNLVIGFAAIVGGVMLATRWR